MSPVDVIVPCYRYGHFLRDCVQSVLRQSVQQVRVLVIDDASPDNTAEVATELAADPRVTFVRHPTNKGHIQTYNEGIAWTSATYSLLLSADDYLLPGALQRATALMDAHPEVGFTFGKAVELKNGGLIVTKTLANAVVADVTASESCRVLSGMDFIRLVGDTAARNIVPTPTAVVRTDLQKYIGGYRQELPHAGDLEMWLRFAAHSAVGVIAEYQAVSRMHGNNMQNQYYRTKLLPDLIQRRAAFDFVFQMPSLQFHATRAMHRQLLNTLAYEALGHASSALNDGEQSTCEDLCKFAISLNPEITRSKRWRIVQCKRHLGVNLCRAFHHAKTVVRHAMERASPPDQG